MKKKYGDITKSITESLVKFRKEIPDVMDSFSKLGSSAIEENALSSKTKELIALALAIGVRCDGCIGFHVKKLIKLGASRQEILETMSVAIYMGGGPSLMYAAEALSALEELSLES